jgi:hypothetical protein
VNIELNILFNNHSEQLIHHRASKSHVMSAINTIVGQEIVM